jgi:RHS repeat-associated protein
VSTYANNRLNQITGRSVPPYVDVLGVGNPTANVTVRVVGGTTYTAARKGEYFHHALNVPNSTNVYPSIEVKSLYGATQAETNKVFVAAASESPTHDADGNLTQDGRWTYTWDGENRLVQMIRDRDSPTGARQKLVFEYDHQGRRIRKTFSTYSGGWQEQSDLIFLYDGWNLVGEFDANSSNAKVRTYVWGTDLSGTMTGAGGVGGLLWLNNHQTTFEGKTLPTGVQYAAYDGNGNVAALVKATDGSVTARYDYGPFAEPIRASGPMAKANPIRFSTKYTDYQSGLVYYGFRYYGPATGRWPNRDPIEEEGGLNLYGFVQNAPGDDWDWFGLCGCTCKSVSVTFIPGGKKPKVDFYPLQDPLGTFYRYGFIIKIEWTVDGPPKDCKYFVNEPSGGVTGETPKGKVSPSDGTFGNWVEVGQVLLDPLGIPVNAGVGKYKIKALASHAG